MFLIVLSRITLLTILFILVTSCDKNEVQIKLSDPTGEVKGITILEEDLNGSPILIVGDKSAKLLTAFDKMLLGNEIEVLETDKSLPAMFEDKNGNVYNIFGEITGGPNLGEKLIVIDNDFGYWVAISNFYPGIDLHNNPYTLDVQTPESNDREWLVPKEDIFAASGLDNIPSIDDPQFVDLEEENENSNHFTYSNEDLVIILNLESEKRIYPIPLLDYHEIVNDQYEDQYFSLMYCPLTGTTNLWDRRIDNVVTQFGVSGLIYLNNLLPYDRNTESIWIQITGQCINGEKIGKVASTIPTIRTSFKLARTMFHDAKILSRETGFDRNYSRYPYGDYRENNDLLLFPSIVKDQRLENKELVMAITVNGISRAYALKDF